MQALKRAACKAAAHSNAKGAFMKLWHRMRCRTNSHSPIPHHVGWDGEHYRGTCRNCGAAIIRLERGKWRALGDANRQPETSGFTLVMSRQGPSGHKPDDTRS
jgi:hypothetical protein